MKNKSKNGNGFVDDSCTDDFGIIRINLWWDEIKGWNLLSDSKNESTKTASLDKTSWIKIEESRSP